MMFLYQRIAWVMLLVVHGSLSTINACILDHAPMDVTKNAGETENLTCGACTTAVDRNVSFTWEYERDLSHPTNHKPSFKVRQGCSRLSFDYCGSGLRYCYSEIELSPINIRHRGYYTCKATCNIGQSISANAYVKVKGSPLFLDSPLHQNVSRGEDITLSCRIESDPTASINWFVIWTNQNGGGVRALTSHDTTETSPTGEPITTSTANLAGVSEKCEVFCTASNTFGAVNSTVAVINIKEVPEMVRGVSASEETATSLLLTWTLGFDGYAPIVAAHIKWQPVSWIENVTQVYNKARTVDIATTERYLISDLYPATHYDIRVAVSNDQGLSNWSEPYQVKTMHTAPPAPRQVTAECFDGVVNISWTRIPYGREHGEVSEYIVTVVSNHETTKKVDSSINHIFVHSHPPLAGSVYKISVCGVTQGGQGPVRNITYHCVPRNTTQDEQEEEDQDMPIALTTETLTTETIVSFSTMAIPTETSHEQTFGTTDSSTTKDEPFLTTEIMQTTVMPQPVLSLLGRPSIDQHQSHKFHKHSLAVPVSVVAVILLGVFVVFAYSHYLKRKHRNIQLNATPYLAYIESAEQTETTNEELQRQSHNPYDLQAKPWPQTNPYQTHIINLVQDQQANGHSFGDTTDKVRLLRIPSEEYDYENSIADFAHQINLDEESKGCFYKALVPIQQLTTGTVVGEGEFGEVSFGYLNHGTSDQVKVAIKKLKDITNSRSYETFIKEGVITMAFDHRNVLAIIGISLDEDISGCIIPLVLMPFMENGDLRTYLYNARVSQKMVLSLYQLVGFMLDIAAGMEYLADKKFVHRDLAARNCMLDNNFTVKIADFGLTRKVCGADYYRICKNGRSCKIPVKWVAIESLRDGKFTTNSDVWAYGVTMWEIITQSQIPYPGVSNCNMYQHLLEGNRLKAPPGCPAELYNLMYICWEADEQKRPSFLKLKESLLDLLLEWKTTDIEFEVDNQGAYCDA